MVKLNLKFGENFKMSIIINNFLKIGQKVVKKAVDPKNILTAQELVLLRNTVKKPSLKLADDCFKKAETFAQQNNFFKAVIFQKHGINLSKKLKAFDCNTGNAFKKLGDFYANQSGKLKNALNAYDKSLPLLKEWGQNLADVLLKQAKIMNKTGLFDKAVKKLNQAVVLFEKASSTSSAKNTTTVFYPHLTSLKLKLKLEKALKLNTAETIEKLQTLNSSWVDHWTPGVTKLLPLIYPKAKI